MQINVKFVFLNACKKHQIFQFSYFRFNFWHATLLIRANDWINQIKNCSRIFFFLTILIIPVLWLVFLYDLPIICLHAYANIVERLAYFYWSLICIICAQKVRFKRVRGHRNVWQSKMRRLCKLLMKWTKKMWKQTLWASNCARWWTNKKTGPTNNVPKFYWLIIRAPYYRCVFNETCIWRKKIAL